MTQKRITNLVLWTQMQGLKELFIAHNKGQDERIKEVEKTSSKNSVAIAGMKGMVIGISALLTLAINTIVAFFTFKGTGA